MGRCPLRVELDGAAELGHRLVEQALVPPAHAKVVVECAPLGVELDGAAELDHRLVEPAPGLPAHAKVVVGRCPFGSSSMARRNSTIASSSRPLACQHMPRWWWAGAPSGSSSMARRNSAIASSRLPLSCQYMPRWWWACGPAGLSSVARRNSAIASSCRPLACKHTPSPWWAQARLGNEFDGAAEFGERLVELAPGLQAQAQAVVERTHVRGELDRLAGGPERLVRLAVVLQGEADAEVDFGRSRPHRQGGPVEAHRVRRLPVPERLAQRVVEPEVLRVPLLRRPQQRLGLLVLLSQLLRQERHQRGRRPAKGCPLV